MSEFARSLAVIIGIDQYRNGISPLQTATNDAREIARILELRMLPLAITFLLGDRTSPTSSQRSSYQSTESLLFELNSVTKNLQPFSVVLTTPYTPHPTPQLTGYGLLI